MIKQATFRNFRALRDTTLPLAPFCLIVGPNSSGKSTALRALSCNWRGLSEASTGINDKDAIQITLTLTPSPYAGQLKAIWQKRGENKIHFEGTKEIGTDPYNWLRSRSRVFSLNAEAIVQPIPLDPHMELAPNGANLAGVLDGLRDQHPEQFEALNAELGRWLPEFDRVLFSTPNQGTRAFLLRTREGHFPIPAADLSQGTVLALAILTLAYLPEPPALVGLEEPDRGLHPRLLRDVQDAMYRLSYPERYGEKRSPVQVVATTHSPYLLELYRDHPEAVVLAHKVGHAVRFERLSDRADLDEMLEGAQLGDIWYSGILGGVPVDR